ncbi:MAG TPA: glycoside hydrolase family 30 protein, partial [Firmicutes bacterium]|nr:glycoside hydrolase family 30 protein [Bacillota bacterium]
AYNFGTLIQEPAYRKAYALYFKKFIEAYEKEGIHIQAVHIQNEPVSDQKFPSCVWTGEELRDFIREDIGPLFAESGMDTEIWLGTLNCPYEDYGGWEWQKTNFNRMANLVLRDPEASRYIRGISYQWGGKHALYDTRRAYPNVEIIQTENECGDGNNSWGYMEYIFHLLWFYFEHGVTAYVYWNMVLKQGGLSTWGWRQNSLFCTDGDRLIYNPEFYLIKHVCHFVRPQASFMRIEGSFANNTLCFRNPDGSTVVVVLNPLDTEEELRICVSGEEWVFCAKPHSIQTIVIEK